MITIKELYLVLDEYFRDKYVVIYIEPKDTLVEHIRIYSATNIIMTSIEIFDDKFIADGSYYNDINDLVDYINGLMK